VRYSLSSSSALSHSLTWFSSQWTPPSSDPAPSVSPRLPSLSRSIALGAFSRSLPFLFPHGSIFFFLSPCQVAAWPKHKLQCGRPLDTPSLRSTKATVTPSQLDCLQWMMEYPLTFWGDRIEVRDEDGAFSCREEYHFSLRPFIRPFVPALSRLTSIRNAAVKEKDEGALGVLALFIRALSDTDSVSGPRPLPTLQHLRMLAVFCEVELVEVERCLQIAEEQIGEREPMLASVLKQIQSGEVECVLFLRFRAASFSLLVLSSFPRRRFLSVIHTDLSFTHQRHSPSPATLALLPRPHQPPPRLPLPHPESSPSRIDRSIPRLPLSFPPLRQYRPLHRP
jgi:hypothetical protein